MSTLNHPEEIEEGEIAPLPESEYETESNSDSAEEVSMTADENDEIEDMEGDRFLVDVFTYGNEEYEMTINTEKENYIKMGTLEMNNLNLCLKRAVRELNRFEEEDNG